MNSKRKLAIISILLAGFIFMVSFSTLYAQTKITEGTACSCTLPIPLLIPTFSSLGIFIGSIVYYLLQPKRDENIEKIENGLNRKIIKAIINLLPQNESEIIKMLIDNDGSLTQSKISSVLGKVKAFRSIKSLEKKGLVEKEKYGKTNMIKITF